MAQIKVGGDEEAVRRAAQRFPNQQDQIDHYTQETLSGSLGSTVAKADTGNGSATGA